MLLCYVLHITQRTPCLFRWSFCSMFLLDCCYSYCCAVFQPHQLQFNCSDCEDELRLLFPMLPPCDTIVLAGSMPDDNIVMTWNFVATTYSATQSTTSHYVAKRWVKMGKELSVERMEKIAVVMCETWTKRAGGWSARRRMRTGFYDSFNLFFDSHSTHFTQSMYVRRAGCS